MNKHQIAVEAWNDIIGSIVVCSCSPQQYEEAVSRIESAIEKAVAHLQLQIIALHDELERAARATASDQVEHYSFIQATPNPDAASQEQEDKYSNLPEGIVSNTPEYRRLMAQRNKNEK